jgi:hypothetical protein
VHLRCAVMWIFLVGAGSLGQKLPAGPSQAELELPKGDSAWVLRVVRAGGLIGKTTDDVTINSEGMVSCPTSTLCVPRLSADAQKSLNQLISASRISKTNSKVGTVCPDCTITAITLRRLEAKNKDQTYFAYWDEKTVAKVPVELVSIANSALSLSR